EEVDRGGHARSLPHSHRPAGPAPADGEIHREYSAVMTSSTAGSWIDRSTKSSRCPWAATIGAVLAPAGSDSHWRAPSTRVRVAPGTVIGSAGGGEIAAPH